MIDCQKVGGYLYYIANPEDIDENKLKNIFQPRETTSYNCD